ncbi:MAG: nitronate monooxygenase [Candidatus Helarchaeota archaeon]|nr:nitronate monooxygenase [Candidatus Helarchaeota archaeon]
MIKTEITEMLNIKHPIIQAGMGPFSTEKLAIAVSNAGALGLISHSGGPLMGFKKAVPEIMDDAIEEVNKHTKNTFGINVRVARAQPDAPKCIKKIIEKVKGDSNIEKKLRVIVTSAGDPRPWTKKIQSAGILHFHVAAATSHGKTIEKSGCDAVIASGYEAGGHIALEPVHTFVLLPEIVDTVKIPVIAAGGMCDGKSLAAALAFGAQGVQMGTRMIATIESDFKDNYKTQFVKGVERDTTVLPGFFSPHCRYLKNKWTDELKEKMEKGTPEDELLRFKALGRSLAADKGDENGSLLCGMVVGRIKSVISIKELVESTVTEAEEILKKLPGYII